MEVRKHYLHSTYKHNYTIKQNQVYKYTAQNIFITHNTGREHLTEKVRCK